MMRKLLAAAVAGVDKKLPEHVDKKGYYAQKSSVYHDKNAEVEGDSIDVEGKEKTARRRQDMRL